MQSTRQQRLKRHRFIKRIRRVLDLAVDGLIEMHPNDAGNWIDTRRDAAAELRDIADTIDPDIEEDEEE